MGNYSRHPHLFLNPPKKAEFALFSVLIVFLVALAIQSFLEQAFADSNNAAIAYRSNTGTNTLDSAKYREWNPSTLSWGSEVELPADATASNIRFAWLEFSPVSSKRVIITLQADGTVDSYVCSSACTTTTSWMIARDVTDLWTSAPTGAQRPFDMEFEKTSGDLVLVYDRVSTSTTQELFYRTIPAGEGYFGSESTIDDTTSSLSSDIVYSFIRMDSQRTSGSDVLGLIALDETNSDAIAWRWDGSTWGNLHELTASAAIGTEEDIGVAFETSSGDTIIVAGEGTSMRYNQFTSGAWGTSATFGTIAIGTINWVSIKADPVSTSNALFVLETGASSDLDSQYWSGSAWTDHAEHDAAIDSDAARVADFAWDNTGSQGVMTWGTASGTLSYKTFSGTSTFGSASTYTETGTHPWVQMADLPNPTTGDTLSSMGGALDSTFDIGGIRWDGGSTAPVSTGDGGITADTTVTTYENFKVAWQRSTTAPSWVRASVEGLGLADAQGKDPLKQLSENVGLSDAAQAIRTLLNQLNESVALADSRTFNAARRIDETIGLSDSRASTSAKLFSENLSLADSWSASFSFEKTLAENLESGDSLARTTVKITFENIGFTDNLATVSTFIRTFTENLAQADTIAKSASKFMSENVAAADLVGTAASYVTQLSENVAAADLVGTITNLAVSFTENVSVVDIFENSNQLIQSLSENLAIGDGVSSFFNNLVISLTENLGIGDDISDIMLDIHLDIMEQLAVVYSFFTPQLAYHNNLANEGVGLSDTLDISAEQSLLLNETIGLSDAMATNIHGDDEEQVDEEEGGKQGEPRDHITKIINESIGLGIDVDAETNIVGKNEINMELSETLQLDANTFISEEGQEVPVHSVRGSLDGVTSSPQLLTPSATGSVSVHFSTTAEDLEDVIFTYSVVDKESGMTVLTWSKSVAITNGTVNESIEIPLRAPGDYTLFVNVTDHDTMLATTTMDIQVSWLDTYAYHALVTAAIATAAGLIVLKILTQTRARRTKI